MKEWSVKSLFLIELKMDAPPLRGGNLMERENTRATISICPNPSHLKREKKVRQRNGGGWVDTAWNLISAKYRKVIAHPTVKTCRKKKVNKG